MKFLMKTLSELRITKFRNILKNNKTSACKGYVGRAGALIRLRRKPSL